MKGYINLELMKLIKEALIKAGRPLSLDELRALINTDAGEVAAATDMLVEQGEILSTRKHKFALPSQLGVERGKLQASTRGFAFFIPDSGGNDWFIPRSSMNGAMHMDTVWARQMNGSRDGNNVEGEVVRVAQHAYKRIVGTYKKMNRVGVVTPDEPRLQQDIIITDGMHGVEPGQKVVVELTRYPDGAELPEGKIIEVLGDADKSGTDVLSIIRRYDLYEEFPKNVEKLAQELSKAPITADGREDIRQTLTVTIDGADAKDFDDAISLEMTPGGNYMLGVHIADVSNYVRAGSALDNEAYNRGTSVYLADRVLPMLPTALSNDSCSLNPHEDRLALSCFMEVNKRGDVVDHRIAETIIRSDERLVYENVTRLLEGDADMRERYANVSPMLYKMEELFKILKARRVRRGSIDFDLPEARITVDSTGKPIEVTLRERGTSNMLIEEFMLLCNETIAKHASEKSWPFVYRVHEKPDKDKLRDLNTFLNSFGYSLKSLHDVHPKSVQKLLSSVAGTPQENIINKVVLRSLKKARYFEQNLGHFGLAASDYCHFTSPIRRYPDLMIHRIIKMALHGELDDNRMIALCQTLPQTAARCSEREKLAMDAERAVDDLEKCKYMDDHIGENYDGIISGVTSFGLFVELPNTIEGMIRLTSLNDDYYIFDEKHYRLTGRSNSRILSLGDKIEIKVAGVDMEGLRIEFTPVLEKIKGRRPKPPILKEKRGARKKDSGTR